MHERDELEWQRQEAARSGTGSDAAYQLIAQALAAPSSTLLPADFAAQVARVAITRSTAAAASYEWMVTGLALVLMAVAAWVALLLNPNLATQLLAMMSHTPITQSHAGWVLWLAAALLGAAMRSYRFRPQRHS
jgi:hypothetical protein